MTLRELDEAAVHLAALLAWASVADAELADWYALHGVALGEFGIALCDHADWRRRRRAAVLARHELLRPVLLLNRARTKRAPNRGRKAARRKP